jgi:hypothetical protein
MIEEGGDQKTEIGQSLADEHSLPTPRHQNHLP